MWSEPGSQCGGAGSSLMGIMYFEDFNVGDSWTTRERCHSPQPRGWSCGTCKTIRSPPTLDLLKDIAAGLIAMRPETPGRDMSRAEA